MISQASTLQIEGGIANSLCFIQQFLVVGDNKGIISLWKSEGSTFQFVKTIVAHMHCVDSIVVLNSSDMIIATASQGDIPTIRVWNLNTEVCVATFKGHKSTISKIITFNGKIVSCSFDGSIKIWDYKQKLMICDIDAHSFPVLCMAKSEDQTYVISGGDDCKIKVWKYQSLQFEKQFMSKKGYVQSLCWIGNQKFVSGTSNGDILLWGIRNLYSQLMRVSRHQQPVTSMILVENKLVSVAEDRSVIVWQSIQENKFKKHQNFTQKIISDINICESLGFMATCGGQQSVNLWKILI